MEPKQGVQKLYHSKLLMNGVIFLIIGIAGSILKGWLFSEGLPLFTLPLRLIFLIAPYIAIPLISIAGLIYLVKELAATKKPSKKFIYVLSIILVILAGLSLHLLVTGTIGMPVKVSSYETLAWSPLTIFFLLLVVLVSIVPAALAALLIKYVKNLIHASDGTLRTRYALTTTLMLLVTIPSTIAIYGFVVPALLMFVSLLGLSSK